MAGRAVSPLVAASDTNSVADLVLTGNATGKALTVTHVSVSSGAIASDQMWQALYGAADLTRDLAR